MRIGFIASVVVGVVTLCGSLVTAADYVVVVSASTRNNKDWQPVVSALAKKHQAEVLTYDQQVNEVLEALQQKHPRYTGFVATPAEATREFVAQVHQLTRKYDEDPYTDTLWGIVTGYDAKNALAIAEYSEPLTVRKVASGTEVALQMCQQGQWYDELVKNKWVKKDENGKIAELRGPDDTTQVLVESLNKYQPDLFVTSGHATERDWQIGFSYRNGYFKSQAGQMVGENTAGKRFEVDSPNAKVYLPIGNCLMGHIDGPNAMALAWMNDAGVKQMIGYTDLTWFGYGGWGVLDYFVEQPGRYTLTEAFHANHHALIHSIETKAGNLRGLMYDRDIVAFYGDPKWEARMANAELAYEQELTKNGDLYTFTIKPKRGKQSFEPINTNGSQRGWRPIVQFLPHRVNAIELVEGESLSPVLTDDFLLIPNPREYDPKREYRIVFRATAVEESSTPHQTRQQP